jgi:hypothetical protein
MEDYGEKLKTLNVVYEWVAADGMDCVLKSQLARCLFQSRLTRAPKLG